MLLILGVASSLLGDLHELLVLLRAQYAANAPIYGHRAVISHLRSSLERLRPGKTREIKLASISYNMAGKLALQLTRIADSNRWLLGWVDGGMHWNTGARCQIASYHSRGQHT